MKYMVLIALGLSPVTTQGCETQVKVAEGQKFNITEDLAALQRALKGCKEHFPNNPCLKQFIKTGTLKYQAVCGK